MKKILFFGFVLCLSVNLHATDGDIFVAKSDEGVSLKFRVISEQEKTSEAIERVHLKVRLSSPYLFPREFSG